MGIKPQGPAKSLYFCFALSPTEQKWKREGWGRERGLGVGGG